MDVMVPLEPGMLASRLTEWLRATREERAHALSACLDRIHELDPSIQAWVRVEPQAPTGDGPLAGIPFGAKDIIDTKGLVTEYGSPIYRGRRAPEDAEIVARLRRLGAVLLGKTRTTAFAYRTPAPTRNPRNPLHTPGGSSSGSAAAVAAGMVPLAIGTQTQGSVLRPASFCGVVGFKPTFGWCPMDGVLPLAPSLDTLGFFTATAADMLALWSHVGRVSRRVPDVGRVPRRGDEDIEPRTRHLEIELGVADPPLDVEPPMAAAFQAAIERLRGGGTPVTPVSLGDLPHSLNGASRVVMAYEAARVHAGRYAEHGDRLADLADLIREGHGVPEPRYQDALRHIAECRIQLAALHERTPIILVPAAAGPAPAGLSSTGDPRMNAPWTALGTPAVAIPMGEVRGLPLGLQLVAAPGDDERLLHAAVRVEQLLAGLKPGTTVPSGYVALGFSRAPART
ncbi:MAG: hypothetical protein A3F70_03460 [Acidobacteria bacterium RIFCSPLOWO2_12_FULL_67_14]|nr:MAG: hypothetical protein A3F70_03460 [Acidobacteria bacterium RIFCSPLOWO2_12_FULL_67_14]